MIKSINILFVLFLNIFISCTHKRVDNKSYVVTKDGNGNIQSEINYINDTVMDGAAKYYYKNGIIKEEINYSNGLKEGSHTSYYRDGSIESKIQFKKGVREGTSEWHFPNGKIKETSNWINNKAFGNAIFYYENGMPETFCSYDFADHTRYLIKYDSNGKKIKEEGTVLGQFLLDGNFDSIAINKPMVAKVSVAVPPDSKVVVFVGELIKSKLTEVDTLPVQNNIVTYTQTFKEKGKHRLVTVGEIKDLHGNIVKQDSIYTDITVIE